jgi:DNA-binding MarR family transcriptional regulator
VSTVERRTRDTHRRQIETLAVELRRLGGSLVLYHQSEAAKLGLNPTDARALGVLDETGPVSAGRLAELLSLTTGAVTGVLDRLEGAGLVRRESDTQDRRRILVVPSVRSTGAAEGGQIFGPVSDAFDALARSYGEKELDVILDFVTRTSELLRAEIDIPNGAED